MRKVLFGRKRSIERFQTKKNCPFTNIVTNNQQLSFEFRTKKLMMIISNHPPTIKWTIKWILFIRKQSLLKMIFSLSFFPRMKMMQFLIMKECLFSSHTHFISHECDQHYDDHHSEKKRKEKRRKLSSFFSFLFFLMMMIINEDDEEDDMNRNFLKNVDGHLWSW